MFSSFQTSTKAALAARSSTASSVGAIRTPNKATTSVKTPKAEGTRQPCSKKVTVARHAGSARCFLPMPVAVCSLQWGIDRTQQLAFAWLSYWHSLSCGSGCFGGGATEKKVGMVRRTAERLKGREEWRSKLRRDRSRGGQDLRLEPDQIEPSENHVQWARKYRDTTITRTWKNGPSRCLQNVRG